MPATASARLHRLALEVGEIPHRSMITAAKAVKDIAAQEARRATGDGTITVGRKNRRVRFRAVDDIRPAATATTCRVQGVPVGPWVWINTGTARHLIGGRPKGSRRRKVIGPQRPGTGAHLNLGNGWVTGPIGHPGGRGAGAWRSTVTRSARIVPDLFRAAVREAVNGG